MFLQKSFDENKLYPYSQVPDFIKLFEKLKRNKSIEINDL